MNADAYTNEQKITTALESFFLALPATITLLPTPPHKYAWWLLCGFLLEASLV